jgi:hypothetical protein
MAVFIVLVFVAYVYVWKKGGLDWSETLTPLEEPIQPGADHGVSQRAPLERKPEAVDAR